MRRVGGDLDVFGISNLLQMLSGGQVHGIVTIAKGPQKKSIQFLPGAIRLVSGVRRTNPLGEILVRGGTLSSEQLEDLLERQKKTGQRLGDLVVDLGILRKESLEAALREQVAEEIYELFTWTDASFEFTETLEDPPAAEQGPLAGVLLDSNIMSLMIEAARRMDELEKIRSVIPDERLIPKQVELPVSFDDLGLEPKAVEEVLPLADGTRSIGKIIDESLYPRFTVLRTLYGLSERGILKIRDQGVPEGPVTVIGRRSQAPTGDGRSSGRGKVLIVSELATFRAALSWFLRNEGYSVVEGKGWDSWAESLCQECVSAVVLDIAIESDDSLAVCERLRSLTKIPFIVLSSNANKKAMANAMRSGARHVLVKPLNERLLSERLAELLAAPASATGNA
jgi:CheY-like chemotaxis protein